VRVSNDTNLNTSPAWTSDGALIFVSGMGGGSSRDLWMQRISSDLKPRGDALRITTGLNAHTISTDRSGQKLAYSVFTTVANVWSTPIPSRPVENPNVSQVTSGNQTIEAADVSPDGKWLAYDSNLNGNADIFKIPIAGGEPQQLTHNGFDNFVPRWSPDGTQIAFHSLLKGNRDAYVMDASGGNMTPAVSTPAEEYIPVWAPDGNSLLYFIIPDSIYQVTRTSRRPDRWGKPRFLLNASVAAFTRDGRQIVSVELDLAACTTCIAGIFTRNPDGSGRQKIPATKLMEVISSPGNPISSADSRHLYFSAREKDGTSSIWQLPVNGDPETRLVHFTDPNHQFFRPAFSADSKNFYIVLGDRQSDIWTMELKKK